MTTYTRIALLCAITLLGFACSSEPAQDNTPPAQDASGFEVSLGDGGAADGGAADVGAPDTTIVDTAQDTAVADTSEPPKDTQSPEDTQAAADSGVSDDLGSGLPFDVAQPDTTYTPLKVSSHTPAKGGFTTGDAATFSVTFSSPLNEQSIAEYTVQVTGPGKQTIVGTFTVKGDTFSFKADKPVAPSSRIDVTVSLQVQSFKGEGLSEAYEFHFYTPGYDKTEPYAALAARYAPHIRQGVSNKDAELDLLRALDYDGDWDATNNVTNVANFPAKAVIAWDVSETQSHYYIHYVYSWPGRAALGAQAAFANDTAGATVVVARHPSETPVALETWFKSSSDERRWLWVTKESGLVPAGKQPGQYNVRKVLPLDKLFPKSTNLFGCDGTKGCETRRFEAYLTPTSHQSCLWQDGTNSASGPCAKDASTMATLSLLAYEAGQTATVAEAKGVKPGDKLTTYTYELVSLFGTWYPRRAAPSLWQKPVSYTYKAPSGRPGGDQTAMGSKFLGGSGDFGRPPWAWRWKPANNATYYDLPRGTIFLDPAFALFSRIGGSTAGLKKYDPATKTGWSNAYCFAPLLFVDLRDSQPCSGVKAP